MMTQISITIWNPVSFNFYRHNKIDRPGGGLGILCWDTYKCTPEKQDSLISLTIVYGKKKLIILYLFMY